MSMKEIYEKVARKNGVSTKEVKEEIEKAVNTAYTEGKDDVTEILWQYVPKKGEVPTSEELIAGMDEEVWTCTVPRQKVNQYIQQYPVGNVKHVSGGAELRIISKTRPSENAVREAPTLEDAFLLYFGENGGDEDAAV